MSRTSKTGKILAYLRLRASEFEAEASKPGITIYESTVLLAKANGLLLAINGIENRTYEWYGKQEPTQ